MRIAAGKVVLDFFNNDNLALKHRKLDEVCADLRRKFNLSALEIADFDELERCVLGFAAVIPDTWKHASAQSFLEKITNTIDETSVARVMSEDCEIIEF
ncbi:DUF503 family protein [Bdellovibrionota bacterium FG-2]